MALHEVRVSNVSGEPDVQGNRAFENLQGGLDVPGLTGINTTRIYRVEGVSEDEATKLATDLFSEPLSGQQFEINPPSDIDRFQVLSALGFTVVLQPVVEIGYKPGVMNPEVASIKKSAKDLGVEVEEADSSTEYVFQGDLRQGEFALLTAKLKNDIVERVVDVKPKTLKIKGEVGPIEVIRLRDATDEQLMEMSKDKLFLALDYMQAVRRIFKQLERDPKDAELEWIASKKSDHCDHTTWNSRLVVNGVEKPSLFERIKFTARKHFSKETISAFFDNSGVIEFYDGMSITGKVETHNKPTSLAPYGGVATMVGGVVRDAIATGQVGRVIAVTNMFSFAHPDIDPKLLSRKMINPRISLREAVDAVGDYGNRMGIPTVDGSFHFHKNFRANPSAIGGAFGIIPTERAQKGTPQVKDLIVTVGGRTGRDGIHGATFSSGESTERTSTVNSSAVQIGNAIEEKRVSSALLEARDLDMIRAVTDCGAAGFASAIGEMAEGIGATVDISKAPTKYEGLAPWEIWISESQERMIVAIPPEKIDGFQAVCQRNNVETAVLGSFDGSNNLTVNYGDENMIDLDYEIFDRFPTRVLEAKYEEPVIVEPDIPTPTDWDSTFKKILGHLDVASKESIVRKFDHGVQGSNAMPPYSGVNGDGPNDAAVIVPDLRKPHAMVLSHGMNPVETGMDPYWGAISAATEAVSNYVAVGGIFDKHHAALINNYIWPSIDPESMGKYDRAVDAICDFMDALEVGVNSGKDSNSSQTRLDDGTVIKIPEEVIISVYGKIPDVAQTTSADIKKVGSKIVLVGAMHEGMGGSIFNDIHGVAEMGAVPRVDLKVFPKVQRRITEAVRSGRALACHDVSEGGVLTAIAEMAFGGDVGVDVVFDGVLEKPQNVIFNQTKGMFVVEVENEEEAEALFGGLPYSVIGTTKQDKSIRVNLGSKLLWQSDLGELNQVYKEQFQDIF